jgi:hypothetical protein
VAVAAVTAEEEAGNQFLRLFESLSHGRLFYLLYFFCNE